MMSDKVRESIQVALEQLHDERERIEGAIAKLEGFLGNLVNSATASVKRRGRPADDQKPVRTSQRVVAAKQRSRDGWTDAARQAAADRMRNYWESRREAAAEGKAPTRKRRSSRVKSTMARERSRKGWTPEARDAARERMQNYWNKRRKGQFASG